MPILPPEPDLFPEHVLDELTDDSWWAIYTLSRQEKTLMRKLRALGIAHYGPMIARRSKSPAGRVRTSFLPLFTNYVFLRGDEEARYEAVSTGCVSRCLVVQDPSELVTDLRQVRQLIETGESLAPESRIGEGDRVRVRSGQFAGYEGRVIRRNQETRLVIAVHFMNQGVSVALEDCQLELIERHVTNS
jgi:transcription antitermination factor NusG